MKRLTLKICILSILFTMFLTSCQSRLQQSAEEFIEAYNNKDFESINKMVPPEFSKEFRNLVENIFSGNGKITEHKFISTGFSSENDSKKSYLIYECLIEKSEEKMYFRLDYFQKGSGGVPYITGVYINENKEFLENINLYDEQTSDVMNKFYDAIKSGKKEEIFTLLDKEAFPENQQADFLTMINEIEKYYGTITDTYAYYTTPFVEDGQTIVIKQIECTTESGKHYEEITFVKSGDDFKILRYRVREKKEEL